MSRELFLIGAGFNVDAASEAGIQPAPAHYPMVEELLETCFAGPPVSTKKSIEELFQESIASGNWGPMRSLAHTLSRADYYLTPALRTNTANAYRLFLDRFPDASFLTFNYDSLLEILLLKLARWRPEDGFGVPVQAEIRVLRKPLDLPETSQNQILHLHGTFTVYASDFKLVHQAGTSWLTDRIPKFIFDADSIANLFWPFERIPPTIGYDPIERRVIAPVPEKATQEASTFIDLVNTEAQSLISKCERLVVIGYSFNALDGSSYRPILDVLDKQGSEVVLISPEANGVCQKLRDEFREVQFRPCELGFAAWVRQDFPGI